MSGHTRTAACAPADGCTKYASAVPSGVSISTSRSVTSCALATGGSSIDRPTPADIAPNFRRVSRLRFTDRAKSFTQRSPHILVFLRNVPPPGIEGPGADDYSRIGGGESVAEASEALMHFAACAPAATMRRR